MIFFRESLNLLVTFVKSVDKITKATLITYFICTNMYAQESFGSYMDRLFFNSFSTVSDSNIRKFLADFAPKILESHKDRNGWSAYSSSVKTPPIEMSHSYIFKRYPVLDLAIKEGELKIYTYYFPEFPESIGIRDIQIILEFKKLDDATKFFEKLKTDLIKLGREPYFQEDQFTKSLKIYSRVYQPNLPPAAHIQLETQQDMNRCYQLIIGVN
jgi:hypothetical protein